MIIASPARTIGPRSYWSSKALESGSERLMNAAFPISNRDPKSIQRLDRTFTASLSAGDLAEPLLSIDDNQPFAMAEGLMRSRNVSVLGVRRDGLVTGWICKGDQGGATVGESTRAFLSSSVFETDATFDNLLGQFLETDHVFIQWHGEVAAVISRSDLQKPALRMWLFGAITIFDTNLTWAIQEMYPGDSWHSLISTGRLEKARTLHEMRMNRGTECSLVDCLQIKDKTDIVVHDRANLAALGIASRSESERITKAIEKLRNHLAHAQELDAGDLEIAARLASLIRTILSAEGARRLVELQRAKKLSNPAPKP
jgi:hypothetical protein